MFTIIYKINKKYTFIGVFLTMQRQIQVYPQRINILLNRGEAFYIVGGLYEAKDCFDQVLEIDRDNLHALIRLGEIAYYFGELEEADNFFMGVWAIDRNNLEGLYGHLDVLIDQGRYREAIDQCYRILVLVPYDRNIRIILNDLLRIIHQAAFFPNNHFAPNSAPAA